ncbi:leucine-rich repeat protein [Perkinsela sp. CCAP 1560/4]|nr:leucine-rich repeat protein [Perkinsela sp. CCAP 1560/4]|eukprot:KNH06267.1 leucine-rich repeat protein [Perkinsela sp. CCAP 1560/4]
MDSRIHFHEYYRIRGNLLIAFVQKANNKQQDSVDKVCNEGPYCDEQNSPTRPGQLQFELPCAIVSRLCTQIQPAACGHTYREVCILERWPLSQYPNAFLLAYIYSLLCQHLFI